MIRTTEDAIEVSPGFQHTHPCDDCPWRRKSIPGWLGSLTADGWIQAAHGETVIDCHSLRYPGGGAPQCAGNAIYRRNVAKLPRPPLLVLQANREHVFASPTEFRAHHCRSPK